MYEKLPAVEGSIACITCECGAKSDLAMDRHIAVGFGSAGYSKNGQFIWEEGANEYDDCPKVSDVEKLALAEPEADWRIFFFAPLYEAEYQRQGEGMWVLVRKGEGFA